jgi:hypothetical protein
MFGGGSNDSHHHQQFQQMQQQRNHSSEITSNLFGNPGLSTLLLSLSPKALGPTSQQLIRKNIIN